MIKSFADLTDAQLLTLIGAGDTAAFRLLVTNYYGPFMAMALADSLSRADSEEAVGDAFLKIWSSAGKYEDVGIDPKYWLRTLMRHALLDKLRSVKRFAAEQSATKTDAEGEFFAEEYDGIESTASEGFKAPVDELESKQANACFDACLNALSAVQTRAVYLRQWQDITIDQFIQIVDSYIRLYGEKRIKISLGSLNLLEYRVRLGLTT